MSHGPVSPKRVEELEVILRNCVATRLYASALLDFRQFKQHVDKTAWETEVWVGEILDHLIHFNGLTFNFLARSSTSNPRLCLAQVKRWGVTNASAILLFVLF